LPTSISNLQLTNAGFKIRPTRSPRITRRHRKKFSSEGLFGLAKRLYGADEMPYRSTPMNQIAGLMIGIAMELSLLARHGVAA
jgi:hypothetical protein